MLSSFYGGKQGRSYHIVAHYDSIYDMFTHFAQGPGYTDVAFDEYVIIDTILHNNNKQDIENGIIYRRGYNYNESFSGQADSETHKINRDRSIKQDLSGNEIGVPYRYEQDKTNNYGSMNVTVTIPEFYDFTYTFIDSNTVVIDENSLILNLNKWNQVWNDYVLNPGGGAIYVGQIVGPEGSSAAASLVDWDTFEQVIEERPQETNKGKFFVTPYPGYDSDHAGSHPTEDHLDEYGYDEQGFLDVQQYGYCTVRDIQGNITNTFLAFSFPYVIFNIEAQGISAYPTNGGAGDYTDLETGISYHFNSTTRLWEYENLIKENPDSISHKFYKHYDIKIPKGVHGQDVNELTIKHRGLFDEYADIYDEDGNYLDEALEHNPNGSIKYDTSGNPILKTDLTNQYLTYKTKNYDIFEDGTLSEINSVSPFRIIANVNNSTKIDSPEVSLENINKYVHNYPKEIVWHYTHGADTKVDYSIIERIWVQVGDATDPAYDENGELSHLINNHLYVLYSTEPYPRDLGLIKEVEDIWIQAENDPNHPGTKEIDDQGNTVKKDYIYTQLTNEIYPRELGFIRKITSITKDADNKDIYVNYNYNATGGVENASEKIPIVEINKVAFNGDLFLLQLKDIEGHEAEYEQTYSYNGEQWINLGNVVRGGKIEAEFETFDDLILKYPNGFGYDYATENRAGWLAIVGHDEPIIIHKVSDSEGIKKYPVDPEDAIISYDEQSGTNIIELPEGSIYSDTTDLEIEAPGNKRLYGFDYFRNQWVSIQDMGSENVKPEYSLLVAPPDATGNQPNSINKNQLHTNGVWFVEFTD